MVTLRVYDGADMRKKFRNHLDRYKLYIPLPKKLWKEYNCMGIYLGFNFTENAITRYCWEEAKNGLYSVSLGRKMKREKLPQHVQKWVEEMEDAWNKATYRGTPEDLERWNRI